VSSTEKVMGSRGEVCKSRAVGREYQPFWSLKCGTNEKIKGIPAFLEHIKNSGSEQKKRIITIGPERHDLSQRTAIGEGRINSS